MPLENAFLIINLGCEMLYVVDQRLKAQCITLEKSTQVLRDLTCVLLDPRFMDKLLNPHRDQHQLLTPQQCRILLNDIACCSLMRLDTTSMDKLWDLMVMVVKWQIANIKDTQQLLDLTFRHMDGVGKLIPETRKTILIDCAKRHLIEFWDSLSDGQKGLVLRNVTKWIHQFNVKISILIRLGFQRMDGTFETECCGEHFKYFADNIGENIYVKHANLTSVRMHSNQRAKKKIPPSHELASFVNQLNINYTVNDESKVGNILEEVNFAMENELSEDNNEIIDPSSKIQQESHFVHLLKSKSTLQSILEKCDFDNMDQSTSEQECNEIDVTDELLKMLDKEE